MGRQPTSGAASDEDVIALLERYACPMLFHEVRTRFLGSIATPVVGTSPIKTMESLFVDDKAGKPAGIHQFIGKRPIAVFGNSDGDKQMLEYGTIGNPRPSLGVIVRHTDAEREYQYDVNPKSSGTLVEAPVLVLACAAEIGRLLPDANLPLKRIRGQISRLPANSLSSQLRTVVCAEGYVAPPREGEHTLGASFDFHSNDLTPSVAEHAGNLELLRDISTDLAERLDAQTLDPAMLEGRAAFRCTSPDYLPIVGPLADAETFAEKDHQFEKTERIDHAAFEHLVGLGAGACHRNGAQVFQQYL